MVQLELFPSAVHLRCIDPQQNKRRFYRLSVQPTLFGEWALVREWRRIGCAGQLRRDLYPSALQAIDTRYAVARAKRRRGYHSRACEFPGDPG